MRAVTIRIDGATRGGIVTGESIRLTHHRDALELVTDRGVHGAHGPDGAATVAEIELATADLAPVVPRPPKIICVGVNYAAHVAEMGHPRPDHPTLFAKYTPALIGAHDDIALPAESSMMDWEAELAVVIGSHARRIGRDAVPGVIAGYAVFNDVTARDWQRRTSQWLQGKTFEGTTPVGPALVTPDELGDPSVVPDLEITCSVDGQQHQRARTSQMLFDPFEIVSYISTFVTLEPGDVIATGTPAGVGAGMHPPRFLDHGQVVTTTIEGVGVLRNRCQRTAPAPADG